MARGHADLVEAAKLRDADIERLARKLYDIKAAAYRDSLLEAQAQHGGTRSRIILSPEIRDAIADEADEHARFAIATFNRMIDRFARKHSEVPREQFALLLADYARRRAKSRSRVVADIAPLTARLDATVSFYRENGVEPEFDFVGPPPKCDLCRMLKARNPHPIETVLEVGYPHLNCTHRWRGRSRAKAALEAGGLRPGQISAGRGRPAGILGSKAMLMRLGTQDAALAEIERLP